MRVIESNLTSRIVKQAMRKLLKSYNLPKPTSVGTHPRDVVYYCWERRDENSLIPHFSMLSDSQVYISCWYDKDGNGRYAISTSHPQGGVLFHLDCRGWFSSEQEATDRIFNGLSRWVKEHWGLDEVN